MDEGRKVNLESTATLLALVRGGDFEARERLIARYLPMLQRWAHGRLPHYARDLADTDDLVQISLLRALDHVGEFEPRREGAFLAYLRQILLNSIRDEIRRTGRKPGHEPLDEKMPDRMPSMVERILGKQKVERYEAALARLNKEQQEAVILRIEFGFTFPEISEALGGKQPNTVRMMVVRALVRLAEAMDEDEPA